MRLLVVFVASFAIHCTAEVGEPAFQQQGAARGGDDDDDGCGEDLPTLVVDPGADLAAVFTPQNAGRRIRLRAGDYPITQTLTVPDGATVVGDGHMIYVDGLPAGFEAGTASRILASSTHVGDVIRLGNGATLRRILVEDVARPTSIRGNVVGIVSRAPGDVVDATIEVCEIVNPNGGAVSQDQPSGRGVSLLALNIQSGANPPPHNGSTLTATVRRTIIRAPGGGSGIFAIPFAAESVLTLFVERSVIGGGLDANGGVSRPDSVHDSALFVHSERCLYRSDTAAGPTPLGWQITGGSTPPVPGTALPSQPSLNNTFVLSSHRDRIEGFSTGIIATGGRRYFADQPAPSGHYLELDLNHLEISSVAADLRLFGARSETGDYTPGNDHTLRVRLRNTTGSGPRANEYFRTFRPGGVLTDPGANNNLEMVGTVRAFQRTNTAIDPAPPADLFTP